MIITNFTAMNKLIIIISIILFTSQLGIAQNYKKAFKALNNKEYTSARVQFIKAQKQPQTKAIGDYGIAVIQRSTSMRIEDLYSAYKNIINAKKNWSNCGTDVKKKNKNYITEDIINSEFIKIDTKLFAKVKADGSSKALERFIKDCPESSNISTAIKLRNKAAYAEAMRFNTIPVWKEFIVKYPKSEEAKQAQENINKLAWKEASFAPSIIKLENFIQKYPNSPKIAEAKNMLMNMEYKKAIAVNTDAAFANFIIKYPTSSQAKDLQSRSIENDYNTAKTFKDISICLDFLNKHPNSKYTKEISELRDSLVYTQTRKINTPKAYEEFIIKYPNAKQVPQAMAKMGTMIYSKEELNKLSQKNKIKSQKLKSMEAYKTSISDTSKRTLIEKKTYDVFGNCIFSYLKTTPELAEINKYSYDDAGDKLLKQQYFVNNRIKTISYLTYNIKGQMINIQIVCNFNCLDSTGDYSDTLIYNKDRLLLSKTKRNSLGKIVEQHKYTYDSKGNMVLDTISIVNNDSLVNYTIKYDYDGKGFLLQKTKRDNLGEILSVYSFSYDGIGRVISSTTYDKIGSIYKTYFYNKLGLIESTTIKNKDKNDKEFLIKYTYTYRKSQE